MNVREWGRRIKRVFSDLHGLLKPVQMTANHQERHQIQHGFGQQADADENENGLGNVNGVGQAENAQREGQQRAQQQARQAYQNGPQNQGYYNPFDPFGFYGSQSGSEEDSSDPNQNTYYYYWSSNDDPNRQQYQWNYRRPRRSPLGVLGKIVMIWLIIQFLLSMLGSCSVRRYYPSYYYGYTDGSGSAYSDGYTSENASYTWTQTTGQNGSRN